MAAGDTIPGKIRVAREDTEGNTKVVAGPYSSSRVDTFTDDAEEKLYINTNMSSRVTRPAGAEDRAAPDAIFAAGEVMLVQHQSNADNSESHDVSADEFQISVLVLDRNRGRIFPDVLTASDQELTSDPAESATSYVTIFQNTTPDRQEIRLAGSFEVAGVEAA